MKTTFPTELISVQANAGSPTDLALIQNRILQQSLENMYRMLSTQEKTIRDLSRILKRRTAALSPTQGFSDVPPSRYGIDLNLLFVPPIYVYSQPSASLLCLRRQRQPLPHPWSFTSTETWSRLERTTSPMTTTRTITTPSAALSTQAPNPPMFRAPTQVDLVLPPTEAFFAPGRCRRRSLHIYVINTPTGAPRGIVPPLFGQKSARWPDVFALVRQPKLCWAVWGPSKTSTLR